MPTRVSLNTIMVDGKEMVYPINQEVVTIRGIIPGEYTVNLYYYTAAQPGPLEALVKVEKVNPTLETVFVRRLSLAQQDDEQTAVRFSLDRQGRVHDVNDLQKTLTPYALEPGSEL